MNASSKDKKETIADKKRDYELKCKEKLIAKKTFKKRWGEIKWKR